MSDTPKLRNANSLCVCDGPGYCKRHQIQKTKRTYKICSGNCPASEFWRYWNKWEFGVSASIEKHTERQSRAGIADKTISKNGSLNGNGTVKKKSRGGCRGCGGAKPARHRSELELLHLVECEHRGERTRMVETAQCGAPHSTEPVFVCAVHGECTLRKTQCTTRENLVGCLTCKDRAIPKKKPGSRRGRGGMFPIYRGAEWVSNEQLVRDVLSLVPKIPHDIRAVAGIARSGLYPASILSLHLHVPLFSLSKDGLNALGSGWRLSDHRARHGPILVIDDTSFKGGSLNHARQIMEKKHRDIPALFAVVYLNPRTRARPDFYVRELVEPHFLEWNFFNSVYTAMSGYDFDGILCRNPYAHEDDDGEQYRNFLKDVRPLYLPRKGQLKLIVTARLEKYRRETQDWLAKWNVSCKKLVMGPWDTIQDRSRQNMAKWKASHVARSRVRVYVESEVGLSRAMSKYTSVPILCPQAGRVF